MDVLLNDLKQTARLLVKTPGFSLAVIAALALGIGTSTAIFSVVNRVLLNPFAYRDPGRMVMFQNTNQQFPPTGSASPTEFNWWRQQTGAFQDVSAYVFGAANLTGEPFAELISTMRVSADFFRLCGANAIYGRTFSAADDVPNAAKTAVLAYGLWQRHFGSDPAVIGKRIILDGDLYEVIGVMGRNLADGQISEQSMGSGELQIRQPPDVYLPFQLDPNSTERGHYFNVAGRLKPGVSVAAANEQLQASYQEYARTWGPDITPGAGFRVQLLQDAIVGSVRNSLLILLAAVTFVLLIACANVANMLLARAANRKREFAIRDAMGAGRFRIVRQLLTESVLLSIAGGLLGVAAGYVGVRVLLSLSPGNIPRIGPGGSNVVLDWRVLGFSLALSILTGILFGLIPALRSSRADLITALKEDGTRRGTGVRQSKTRAALVAVEMALAVVLLIAAALLIRTFVSIRQVNPGFDTQNVLTMRMLLAGPQFETPAGMTQVLQEGVRRLRRLPGVEVAATSCCVPLEDRFFMSFQIAGRPEPRATSGFAVVSPGYFETFNIPVVRGRTFTDRDESGPRAVVINEALGAAVLAE
jgi:predicted permease